jgi:hypothetical protein
VRYDQEVLVSDEEPALCSLIELTDQCFYLLALALVDIGRQRALGHDRAAMTFED